MFLPVKAYFGIRKAGLAIRLGTEGGTSAALLRNQHTVWSSHRQEAIFEHNSGRPLLRASFHDALCLDGQGVKSTFDVCLGN
jgi:hypothetical protein